MSVIRFGTDGWRGRIARDFTFENVRKVSQAIADSLAAKGRKGSVVVGHDRRFLSEQFAKASAEVFSGNGFKVFLFSKPVPTPLVSYAVVQKKSCGGVSLTASHNPFEFHGLKFKEPHGASATPETTRKIESRLGRTAIRRLPFDSAFKQNKITWLETDASYISSLWKRVDPSIFEKVPLRVLADALHGSAADYLPRALSRGRVRVDMLHAERDVLFGGVSPEPIPVHLTELAKGMKGRRYDIGIALDGDGDRLAAVMPGGAFLSPTKIVSLLLYHFVEVKRMRGKVVKTISGSRLIDRIASFYGLPLEETPVGFKYISEKMHDPDFLIGGEESGGIGFRGSPFPERDGLLSALFLLEAIASSGRSVRQLLQKVQKQFGPLESDRIDLRFPSENWKRLLRRVHQREKNLLLGEAPLQIKAFDGLKLIGRERWILFRMSGTEPLLRIYAEGRSKIEAGKILTAGRRLAEEFLR